MSAVDRLMHRLMPPSTVEQYATDEGYRSVVETGAPTQLEGCPSLAATIIADHKGTGGKVWSILHWDPAIERPFRQYAMLDSAGVPIIGYLERPVTATNPFNEKES